jgi:hypothetical protein
MHKYIYSNYNWNNAISKIHKYIYPISKVHAYIYILNIISINTSILIIRYIYMNLIANNRKFSLRNFQII